MRVAMAAGSDAVCGTEWCIAGLKSPGRPTLAQGLASSLSIPTQKLLCGIKPVSAGIDDWLLLPPTSAHVVSHLGHCHVDTRCTQEEKCSVRPRSCRHIGEIDRWVAPVLAPM
jgi:hypothetical protein